MPWVIIFLRGTGFDSIYPISSPLNNTTMKNLPISQLLIFAVLALTLTGCELVGDIFEAGIWVGVIGVVLVVVLIFWIIRKLMG